MVQLRTLGRLELVSGEPTAAPYNVYYRSNTADTHGIHNYIGGPSGDGWFKMFEFMEVPSTAFKAIGPAAQGVNYDWARQDLKPGLLALMRRLVAEHG